MTDKKLSTDSYKGVRDFYPEDMAVQRYIFETWAKTAESFGYERYDASILEPSDLYRAKGAENEEMINEQTYTFTDRGEREVTLRPEMTPTVARMVAKKRRELAFPLRWYSIPNLFRYERPQRGRLREHWQLNCDIFGGDTVAADVEAIALAYQILIDFGATPEMFEIRINSRSVFVDFLKHIGKKVGLGLSDEKCLNILRLRDRMTKISKEEYIDKLEKIIGKEACPVFAEQLHLRDNTTDFKSDNNDDLDQVGNGLYQLGINNILRDSTISRGFDYYTGTVFEIFDTSSENNRALLGGGRYDNLTGMFGGEPISGIGFGMGDVTMRDFLETHDLLPEHVKSTAPQVAIIPMGTEQNLFAQKIAMEIRRAGHTVSTDIGTKKVGDKISRASKAGSAYTIVIGENEANGGTLTIKHLTSGETSTGDLATFLGNLHKPT